MGPHGAQPTVPLNLVGDFGGGMLLVLAAPRRFSNANGPASVRSSTPR